MQVSLPPLKPVFILQSRGEGGQRDYPDLFRRVTGGLELPYGPYHLCCG